MTIYLLRMRDYEYIINRLYGDDKIMEAIERLQKLGRKEEADELLELVKNYNDQLRGFRRRLESKRERKV
jgi:hypothetical protein